MAGTMQPNGKQCLTCHKPLTAQAKGQYCRNHMGHDLDMVARRNRAIKQAFYLHPDKRKLQNDAIAAANRRPERRARSAQLSRELELIKRANERITPEVRARAALTNSERKLAHVPLAFRDEYRVLVKKLGATEASRIVNAHAVKVASRAHPAHHYLSKETENERS